MNTKITIDEISQQQEKLFFFSKSKLTLENAINVRQPKTNL